MLCGSNPHFVNIITDTNLHHKTTHKQGQCITRCDCLYSSFRWCTLHLPTEG